MVSGETQMDFREKLDRSYADHLEREGVTTLAVDVTTFLAWKAPKPESGDTWGNWRYNAKLLTLTHVAEHYEIRLDECSTSAQMLDWIFQLATKTWMTSEDIGDLIHALKDIINPQANLCSFGTIKTLDVKKYLAKA
jgi:hypothetical protein